MDSKLTIDYGFDIKDTKVDKYNKLPSTKNLEEWECPIDITTNADIEIQEFYDGSVNIIDNSNSLRIVNSGFAINDNVLGEVNRNGNYKTNVYTSKNKSTTNLILNTSIIPIIDYKIIDGGNLMGGNYFFYIKYGTSDGDTTNIIEESKVISIFHGNTPKTSCGILEDERVDKSIEITLSNVDDAFSKVYLWYSRYTSDTNGVKITKCYKLLKGYDITNQSCKITITGDEESVEISSEELNIQQHYIESAQSIAQNQGMLFLAGIKTSDTIFDKDLEKISKNIVISAQLKYLRDDSTNINYTIENNLGMGYYNPQNISDNLGYWPEEFYRLNVVYVYKNGQTSAAYNLSGGLLIPEIIKEKKSVSDIPVYFTNPYGIYYIADNGFYEDFNNTPYISLFATLGASKENLDEAKEYFKAKEIVAWFIVRQQRIPLSIAQGVTTMVERKTGFPSLKFSDGPLLIKGDDSNVAFTYQKDPTTNHWIESFLPHALDYWRGEWDKRQYPIPNPGKPDEWRHNTWFLNLIKLESFTPTQNHLGILNLDSYCVPQLQSLFSANELYVYPVKECQNRATGRSSRKVVMESVISQTAEPIKAPLIYIPLDTPSVYYNGLLFSTRAGSAEDVLSVSYIDRNEEKDINHKFNAALLRGNTTSFIGVCDKDALDKVGTGKLVTIRTVKYLYNTNDDVSSIVAQELQKRSIDKSPFYQISPRMTIENSISKNGSEGTSIPLYGGDCFLNTITIRMQSNFIDPDTQVNDTIVNVKSWANGYNGINGSNVSESSKINRSDINAAQIGTWYTFKCLSNYNLGLRSEDRSHAEEISKMGNWRSFYPKRDINAKASGKVPESSLLNLGLSSVLSVKRYYNYTSEDYPYSVDNYENRIMFSNKYIKGSFENGYRVFQGLNYNDYTREYGKITKIISLGQSLFIVFTNGCAIAPINEKALMQTTEGQSIHMYGAGVLPDQLTLVSNMYGSSWKESVILTPNGIYGVDTTAKSIWRYNQNSGFQVISNMKVSSFLLNNIPSDLTEFKNGITQIRTHYNERKKDVLFTFIYENTGWNLCFNELVNSFICKYSWVPYLSVNRNDQFLAFDAQVDTGLLNGISLDTNLRNMFKYWDSKEMSKSDTNFIMWKSDQSNVTNWFGEQHPFELEFIVNNPLGLHKIFDNLVIISNNVEPKSLEIEIIGDAYNFNKADICSNEKDKTFPKIEVAKSETTEDKKTYYTEVIEDENLEYRLKVHQDALNIEEYGRRIGNLHYTEDKWNITLQPIYYEKDDTLRTTRIRDKYARIRIKYSGEKLVVITAIQTLFRLSYA